MTKTMYFRSFAFITIIVSLLVPAAFASAASLAVQSLSPSATVATNVQVTFTVVASGFNSPTYTIVDDQGYNLSANINPFGSFSWTPQTRDVGVRTLTISATDSGGNSVSINQQITVQQPAASISAMTNGPAATVGKPMTYQITTTGFSNPTFWLGDSVGGSTLTNSKLNSSGAFYWVPTLSDVGSHSMMINVSDQLGHFVDLTQTITVSVPDKPQVQSLSPGTTTPVGGPVSFSVTSPGFTSPTFTVYDSYIPSTVTSNNLSTAGAFTWTPNSSQIGSHNIRVNVRDNTGMSADLTQNIVVLSPNLTVSTLTPGDTVSVGKEVKFFLTTSGLMAPMEFAITDSMPGSSMSNGNISSSGLFIWTPTTGDVGTHNITLRTVDAYGNAANVHVDIKVVPASVVLPPPAVPAPGATPTPAGAGSTAVSGGYTFTRALAIGSSGAEVTALQELLKKLGYFTVTPNGYFGPMTAASVKKFQAAKGLEQVGSVGPGTRAKLNAAGGGGGGSGGTAGKYYFTKPLALWSSGTEVTELQKKLTALGYYSGLISGIFDTGTQGAVKKFQAAKGLEQVGSVGPGTRAALNAQ